MKVIVNLLYINEIDYELFIIVILTIIPCHWTFIQTKET